MTVQASPYKATYTYNGVGSATVFPFAFLIFQAADLVVQKVDASGVLSTLALGTDYTISGVLYPNGGNVTLSVALTSGQTVVIFRDPAVAQATSLQQGGAYDASAVMNALDYLCMEIQAVKDRSLRSPRVPVTESPTEAAFTWPSAAQRANQAMYFDAGGNPTSVGSTTSLPSTGVTQVIDTIALLKALAAPASAVTYLVRGYYAVGDGGGGIFRWNSADATTDNGGTAIQLNAGGVGRWNRVYDAGAVNVRWFGAKGDGATDDTIAIQAAITLALTFSGAVYAPHGTYKTTATLNATGTSFSLFGDGLGTTFAPANGITSWLHLLNVNQPRFYNFQVVHASATNTTDATFQVEGCIMPMFEKIYFSNAFLAFSFGQRSSFATSPANGGFLISNCQAVCSPAGSFVAIFANTNGGQIVNSTGTGQNAVSAGTATSQSVGIYLPGNTHLDTLFILNVQLLGFYNNLRATPVNTAVIIDVFISNFNFDRAQADSVYIAPAAGGTIQGWWFTQGFNHSDNNVGFWLAGSGSVADCFFKNIDVSSCGLHGIQCGNTGMSRIVFDGMRLGGCGQVANNTYNGIQIDNNVANVQVINPQIAGDVAGAIKTHEGIFIGNGCSSIVVRGGRITGCADYGIYVGSSLSNCEIDDVQATGNTGGVVLFSAALNTYGAGLNCFKNIRGLSPYGGFTPPSVPATTVNLQNPFGFTCTVYLVAAGGGGVTVAINGVGNTGFISTSVPAGAVVPFAIPVGGSVTLTYTSAPTWTWYGH